MERTALVHITRQREYCPITGASRISKPVVPMGFAVGFSIAFMAAYPNFCCNVGTSSQDRMLQGVRGQTVGSQQLRSGRLATPTTAAPQSSRSDFDPRWRRRTSAHKALVGLCVQEVQ